MKQMDCMATSGLAYSGREPLPKADECITYNNVQGLWFKILTREEAKAILGEKYSDDIKPGESFCVNPDFLLKS